MPDTGMFFRPLSSDPVCMRLTAEEKENSVALLCRSFDSGARAHAHVMGAEARRQVSGAGQVL
jgi:hypothetical protein